MMGAKKTQLIKSILYGIVLTLLLLPMIQQKLKLVELEPLKGSFQEKPNTSFDLNSWFNGSYQHKKEAYLNEAFGFRNFLVRLYNQTEYSLYGYSTAQGVIVGKSGYLYEENYIKAHLGRDYIGQESIQEKIRKLNEIRKILESKGKDLVVIFAPGKGSFYPEYIPDKFNPKFKTTTNYSIYSRELKKQEFHFIDFNNWFIENKNTSKYPLYPKTGVHWSKYGEVLTADSIIDYISSIRSISNLDLIIKTVNPSKTVRDSDDDIEQGMNLLFNIPDLEMGYAEFEIISDSNTVTPTILTISDSYYWGMFNSGVSRDAFNNGQFWYYNEQIYPDSYDKPINVRDIDIITEVEKNDVIILISTDANLYKFAFGFIDQLYDAYFMGKTNISDIEKEQRIQFYIHSIKETPEWLEKVVLEAEAKKITLDSAIRENAEYMVWSESNAK